MEILARRRGDLGRRREINDRFRALLRGDRQKLGETYKARDQAAALIAEACGDESRMQAISGHARVMKAAGEFTREENVACSYSKAAVSVSSMRGGSCMSGFPIASLDDMPRSVSQLTFLRMR
jgi:hypothetical protein